MNRFEQDYKELLKKVISFGTIEKNRTGVNCYVLCNQEIKFNRSKDEVPLITGKKIFPKKALAEFEWIYNGLTSIDYLNSNGIYWWDQYADEKGNIPYTYGYQLRNYNGSLDQVEYVVDEINAGSRRAYITFWNPTELIKTVLPCCYTGMKFTLTNNGKTLNACLYFRSSDLFLGLPYDFMFGYFMLRNICYLTKKKIGEISYFLTDAHIYHNHIDQVIKYITYDHYELPNEKDALKSNYQSGPLLEAKMNN